jgi:nucleoid-associated protein EbfC
MNQAMIKKLQKMQKDMMKAQKELEETEFTGSAGGVVTITAKGTKEILAVSIKPEAVDPEYIADLEEMVLLATNDVMRQIDEKTQEVMSPFAGGMPGMPF